MSDSVNQTTAEVDRLTDRLCNDPNRSLRNFQITRGNGAATAEQLAAAVNAALDQVRDGTRLIHQITRDDARAIIAALHAVVEDIGANCLFDRDPLLMPAAESDV